MTRLFFAFIALLSGLAAVQAPAHAARQEQLACGVQSPLQAAMPQANPACAAATCVERSPGIRITAAAQGSALSCEFSAPRVLVGIDLALE